MKLVKKYIESKKKSENIDDDFSIKLKERKKRKIRKNSNCFGGKNYQKEKEIKIANELSWKKRYYFFYLWENNKYKI